MTSKRLNEQAEKRRLLKDLDNNIIARNPTQPETTKIQKQLQVNKLKTEHNNQETIQIKKLINTILETTGIIQETQITITNTPIEEIIKTLINHTKNKKIEWTIHKEQNKIKLDIKNIK